MNNIKQPRSVSTTAQLYWAVQMLLGTGVFCWAVLTLHSHDHVRFFAYLLSAIVASVLKVQLPGVTGAASVSFLFMLIGIVDLSLPETIVIAACSMLAQCIWRTARTPKLTQVCFGIASIVIAVYVATLTYNYALTRMSEPLALVVLAIAFYFANTFPIACIIALTGALPLWSLAMRNQWLLRYYVGGTSLAWLIGTMPPASNGKFPSSAFRSSILSIAPTARILVKLSRKRSTWPI